MMHHKLFSGLLIIICSCVWQVRSLDETISKLTQTIIKCRNNSVTPCDNFYHYVCGNKNSVEPLAVRVSESRIRKEMRDLLLKQPDGTESKSECAERKFYKTCVDSGAGEPLLKEIRKFLNLLASTEGLRTISTKPLPGFSKSWQEVDKVYSRLGFNNAFFDIKRREVEPGKSFLIIMPPVYKRRSVVKRFTTFYEFDLKNWTSMIDETIKENPSNVANGELSPRIPFDTMLAFGKKFDEILSDKDDASKMSISDWQKVYDQTQALTDISKINWLDMIKNVVSLANIDVDKSEIIMVEGKEYFKKLVQLLENTPKDVISTYVHVNFIYDFQQLAIGYGYEPPLWRLCLSFFDPVGTWNKFVNNYQLQENHKLACQIDAEIKNYIISKARSNWIDQSKVAEIDKVEKQNNMVGYPDWIYNKSIVDSYYDDLNVTTSAFQNLININQFDKRRDFMRLRKPEMPERYQGYLMFTDMTGAVVEGFGLVYATEYLMRTYYGIFDSKYPRGLNYGALGSEFALYWWNSLYAEGAEYHDAKFVENRKCFEKKVDANELKDSMGTLDKKTFIDRMMVEKSLLATYNAYSTHSDSSNPLPGLEDITDQQLFFIAYALNMCVAGSVEESYFAVNDVLANMNEFSTAFKCPEKSRMSAQNKCYNF